MSEPNRKPSSKQSSRPWSVMAIQSAVTDFRTRSARRRTHGELINTEQEIIRADGSPDATSVGAKSSRHGQSTADKWNQ